MKKTWFILSGYSIGLGSLLLITYRTIVAIGSESKMILVSVNRFGEQYLDMVSLVLLWVICILGCFSLTSFFTQKKNKKDVFEKGNPQEFRRFSSNTIEISHLLLHQPRIGETGTFADSPDSVLFPSTNRNQVSVIFIIQQENSQG